MHMNVEVRNAKSQYLLIEVGFPMKDYISSRTGSGSQYLLIEVGFPMQ